MRRWPRGIVSAVPSSVAYCALGSIRTCNLCVICTYGNMWTENDLPVTLD